MKNGRVDIFMKNRLAFLITFQDHFLQIFTYTKLKSRKQNKKLNKTRASEWKRIKTKWLDF